MHLKINPDFFLYDFSLLKKQKINFFFNRFPFRAANPHSRGVKSERLRAVRRRMCSNWRAHQNNATRPGCTVLITSCRLVCINAGVSIPQRSSGFPRYVAVSRRRRALRASERTGDCCSGSRGPCCNSFPFLSLNPSKPRVALHQVDLTAGISYVGEYPASSPSPKSLRTS